MTLSEKVSRMKELLSFKDIQFEENNKCEINALEMQQVLIKLETFKLKLMKIINTQNQQTISSLAQV